MRFTQCEFKNCCQSKALFCFFPIQILSLYADDVLFLSNACHELFSSTCLWFSRAWLWRCKSIGQRWRSNPLSSYILHMQLYLWCGGAVIRRKQTCCLTCLQESTYADVRFNIYCTCCFGPRQPRLWCVLCACHSESVFPIVCPTEPSWSPLQGPQARQETQSHGGPEEQAPTIWWGLEHGPR